MLHIFSMEGDIAGPYKGRGIYRTMGANTGDAYSAASLSPFAGKVWILYRCSFLWVQGMNLIGLTDHSISIPLANRTIRGSSESFCSLMPSPHVRLEQLQHSPRVNQPSTCSRLPHCSICFNQVFCFAAKCIPNWALGRAILTIGNGEPRVGWLPPLPTSLILCTWKNKCYLFKGRASSDKQRRVRTVWLKGGPRLCARIGVGSNARVVRKRKPWAESREVDAQWGLPAMTGCEQWQGQLISRFQMRPWAVRGLLWPTDLHLPEGQVAALVGRQSQTSLNGAGCGQDWASERKFHPSN